MFKVGDIVQGRLCPHIYSVVLNTSPGDFQAYVVLVEAAPNSNPGIMIGQISAIPIANLSLYIKKHIFKSHPLTKIFQDV